MFLFSQHSYEVVGGFTFETEFGDFSDVFDMIGGRNVERRKG